MRVAFGEPERVRGVSVRGGMKWFSGSDVLAVCAELEGAGDPFKTDCTSGSGGWVSDEGVGRRSMRLSESERVRKYLGRRSGQERRGRLNEIGGDWGRFGEI